MLHRSRTIIVAGFFLLFVVGLLTLFPNGYIAKAQFRSMVYLPIILKQVPPQTPTLDPIDNTDQDRYYYLSWSNNEYSEFILQEASKADFSDAVVVQQGYEYSWAPSSDKLPGTYFYRAAAVNQFSRSAWSNVQSITINPLFVGLNIRWDGNGYIRGSEYYDIGTHETKQCDTLRDWGHTSMQRKSMVRPKSARIFRRPMVRLLFSDNRGLEGG